METMLKMKLEYVSVFLYQNEIVSIIYLLLILMKFLQHVKDICIPATKGIAGHVATTGKLVFDITNYFKQHNNCFFSIYICIIFS